VADIGSIQQELEDIRDHRVAASVAIMEANDRLREALNHLAVIDESARVIKALAAGVGNP